MYWSVFKGAPKNDVFFRKKMKHIRRFYFTIGCRLDGEKRMISIAVLRILERKINPCCISLTIYFITFQNSTVFVVEYWKAWSLF